MTYRFFVAMFAWLFLAQIAMAQVIAEEPVRDREITFLETVEWGLKRGAQEQKATSLSRELAVFQKQTAVTDKAMNAIRKAVQTIFDRTRIVADRIPPSEVLAALIRAAKEVDCDPKLLTNYQKDLRARLAFEEEMTVLQDVYMIDSFVGLTNDQWEQVRKLSAQNYRNHCRSFWIAIWYLHFDHVKRSSKARLEPLRKVLDSQQNEWLEAFAIEWDGELAPAEFNQTVQQIGRMRLRQLDAAVNLSDRQTAKLRVAGMSTLMRNAIRRRRQIKADLDLTMTPVVARLMKGGAKFKDTSGLTTNQQFEASNLSGQKLPMLYPENRWLAFVNSTLDEQQKRIWNGFTDRRQRASFNVQAFNIGRRYLSDLPLTGKQWIAVHELLKESVQGQAAGMESCFCTMINPNTLPIVASKAEFISVIGKDNWALLDEYRAEALPFE